MDKPLYFAPSLLAIGIVVLVAIAVLVWLRIRVIRESLNEEAKGKAEIFEEPKSYECYHVGGMNPCGGLAWTFIEDPRGQPLRSLNVVMPDGSHPERCTKIVCGSCGDEIRAQGEPVHRVFELRAVPRITS